jgi:hypothetical protein
VLGKSYFLCPFFFPCPPRLFCHSFFLCNPPVPPCITAQPVMQKFALILPQSLSLFPDHSYLNSCFIPVLSYLYAVSIYLTCPLSCHNLLLYDPSLSLSYQFPVILHPLFYASLSLTYLTLSLPNTSPPVLPLFFFILTESLSVLPQSRPVFPYPMFYPIPSYLASVPPCLAPVHV